MLGLILLASAGQAGAEPEAQGPCAAALGVNQTLWSGQRLQEGLAASVRGIAACAAAGDTAGQAKAYRYHYYFANALGHKQAAYDDLVESALLYRNLAKAGGDPKAWEGGQADTLVWLSELELERGDPATARAMAEEMRAIRARQDSPGGLAVVEQTLGKIAMAEKKYAEAAAHYDSAVAYYETSGNPHGVKRYRQAAQEARRKEQRTELQVEAPAPPPPPEPQAEPERLAPRDARAALASLRFALTVFMAENPGMIPASLKDLRTAGTIQDIPRLLLPDHVTNNLEVPYPGGAAGLPARLKDLGGWGYDRETGDVFIDCTHEGPSGPYWKQ